jgi:small-conductance mechanosensitive channel
MMSGLQPEMIDTWLKKGIPFLLIPACYFIGLLARKFLLKRLVRMAPRTRLPLADMVISAVRTPFMLWALMLGLYLALQFSSMPQNVLAIMGKILLILTVISLFLVASNVSVEAVRRYGQRLVGTLPITSLTQHMIRIIFFGLGLLIILNSLGISVTPLLATLGIGGLAVALALQDTLSNVFAGFHILASRQLRVGDYIRLESGESGYVVDIGWRTTTVRMLQNNIVVVPNSKISKSLLINYYLPEKELAVLVDLGVHYDSDLELVEAVVREIGKDVMRTVPGSVPDFDPFIRYHTFGDSGIQFTVILRAREFVDQYLVKHEFVKRLHERFRREGIIIPYPMRTVIFERGGSDGPKRTLSQSETGSERAQP